MAQVSNLRKAVYVGRSIASTTGKTVRKLLRDEVASFLPGGKVNRCVWVLCLVVLRLGQVYIYTVYVYVWGKHNR